MADMMKISCQCISRVLLLIQALLLCYIAWNSSPNRTEIGHIAASAYLWQKGKFDVFSVNPPLIRIIAGLPIALFCSPHYNWRAHSTNPMERCEWPLGNTFVSINAVDDVRFYFFLARLACIPVVLLGGYVGFRFASELYGESSGFVFQILWTFSPLILGWGATICPDVAAASLGIVGLYSFWHWLQKPSWSMAGIAGICLGLMLLTKTTWIIAVPLWATLWFVWQYSTAKTGRRWKQGPLFCMFLVALYVLNMGYFFDGTFKTLGQYQFYSQALSGQENTDKTRFGNRFEHSWLGKLPVPLPKDYVQGIDTQKRDFEKGFESYQCGKYSDRGWRSYYLYVLALKEPLGTLALAVLAVGTTLFFRCYNARLRDEMILLFPIIALFVFVSSQNGISMHARYIIPVLPFLYIWISKLGRSFGTQKPGLFVVVILCLACSVGSSLYRYPYSMSYFNELIGGPENGGKYLLGSNVDWGQDEYELRDWVKAHPEAQPLYISYQPSIPLSKLGISYAGPVPEEFCEGWVVLGVNNLHRRDEQYGAYQGLNPVARIGWSIVVYKVKGE